MEERLKKLKKMSRQYRFDIDGSFCKVWNGGRGRLTFVVPLESEKKVLVNSTIARNKDYERVAEVFPEFEIVKVAYGYSDFLQSLYALGISKWLCSMKVVFRIYPDGQVIALFPEESDKRTGETMSYMHIGQHGGADYHGVIQQTKPATEKQYIPLLKELNRIGYNDLQVRQKSKLKWV